MNEQFPPGWRTSFRISNFIGWSMVVIYNLPSLVLIAVIRPWDLKKALRCLLNALRELTK